MIKLTIFIQSAKIITLINPKTGINTTPVKSMPKYAPNRSALYNLALIKAVVPLCYLEQIGNWNPTGIETRNIIKYKKIFINKILLILSIFIINTKNISIIIKK